MMIKSEIAEKLAKPLESYERQGKGGVKFSYHKGDDIIRRLNDAFSYNWDSIIVNALEKEDAVIVQIRLTARVLMDNNEYSVITKEAFGGAKVLAGDITNCYKAANTAALKKCAEQFGIGLDSLSDEDQDFNESSNHTKHSFGNKDRSVGAAVAAATVSVKPPKIDDSKIAEAMAALREHESGKASAAPPSKENTPVNSSSLQEKTKTAGVFPSKGADTVSEIQISAIEKLCSSIGVDSLDYANKVLAGKKTITAINVLTKTDAIAIIKELSKAAATRI